MSSVTLDEEIKKNHGSKTLPIEIQILMGLYVKLRWEKSA